MCIAGLRHDPILQKASHGLKVIMFRLGCHHFPIEALRYSDVPRAQRLCVTCDSSALGDEQHLLFKCPSCRLRLY